MSEGSAGESWILLVEDNLTDAILAQAILERDGDIRVVIAQDGVRGCQLVEAQRWDLVLTDLNLPGRDGIEVLRTSKAHQPDTPVIAMSAYSHSEWKAAAEHDGANEVLSKPLDPAELMRSVRVLLAQGAAREKRPRRILAVSALPGDVEAGCAGTLLKCAEQGDQVEVLVLSCGAGSAEGADGCAATKKACGLLGLRLHLPPHDAPGLPETERGLIRIRDAVEELSPHLILAPSAQDVRDSRRRAFEAAKIAGVRVDNFLCYQAATTTLEFRPTVFEEISESMDQKMLALAFFRAQMQGRPHLDPDFMRATARYWGRYLGYGLVEPFEVVRQQL